MDRKTMVGEIVSKMETTIQQWSRETVRLSNPAEMVALETECLQIGQELARKLLQAALQSQAEEPQAVVKCTDCGNALYREGKKNGISKRASGQS